jgi:hypothetical protein
MVRIAARTAVTPQIDAMRATGVAVDAALPGVDEGSICIWPKLDAGAVAPEAVEVDARVRKKVDAGTKEANIDAEPEEEADVEDRCDWGGGSGLPSPGPSSWGMLLVRPVEEYGARDAGAVGRTFGGALRENGIAAVRLSGRKNGQVRQRTGNECIPGRV